MRPVHDAAYICTWLILIDDCVENVADCPVISPGYPGDYPPNTECSYHVTTRDVNTALQIKFSNKSSGGESNMKPREFDLRETDRCAEDYLEIFDGQSSESQSIGRFCGNSIPDVTSSGSHVYMVFVSGPATPPFGHVGFHGSVLGVSQDWFSGGVKTANPCDWFFNVTEGSVTSPDHWLPPNTKCTYKFHLLPKHHLDVIINVYGLGSTCSDSIELLEGHRLVHKICSQHLPASGLSTGVPDATRRSSPEAVPPLSRDELAHNHLPKYSPGNLASSGHQHQQQIVEKTTIEYQLRDRTSNIVAVRYSTASGQWQSTADRGFWMSFRQRRDVDRDDVSDVTSQQSTAARQAWLTERLKSPVDRRADDASPKSTPNRQVQSLSSSSAAVISYATAALAVATVMCHVVLFLGWCTVALFC